MRKRWFVFMALLALTSCNKKNNNDVKPDDPSDIETVHYEAYHDGYMLSGIDDKSIESITIPDKYKNKDVIGIRNDVFLECTNLKNISLPSTLESISSGLFNKTKIEYNEYNDGYYLGNENNPYLYLMKYNNVESTKIHDGTKIICDNVFKDFKLNNIELNNSLYKISYNSFANNDYLYSIKLPSGLKVIEDNAFINCDNLYEIYNFSSLDITLLSAEYGNIAYNARKITKDKNEESALTITDDFITINCDNKNILLKYLSDEENVNIPNNIDIIGTKAFMSSNIKEIDLEGISIVEDNAFKNCESLEKLKTGNTLTEIGAQAFAGDENLSEIILGDSVSDIKMNAFRDCEKINAVKYDGTVDDWSEINFEYDTFNNIYSNPMKYAKEILIKGARGYERIIDLDIPSTVEIIPAAQFMNFSSIETITFEGNVNMIEPYAFMGCAKLEEVYIPNGVESLEFGIFSGCINLDEIYFGKNIKTIYNIFGETFRTDEYIGMKPISKLSYSSDEADWMKIRFVDSYSNFNVLVDKIYFTKNDVEYIPTSIEIKDAVSNYTFRDFTSIDDVYIDRSVTEFGTNAFLNAGIKNVYYKGSIDDWVSRMRFSDYSSNPISSHAKLYVYSNNNYVEVVNPVITISTIQAYSFYNSNIVSIILPRSLRTIGYGAFKGCDLLIDVYYLGDEESYNNIGKYNDSCRLDELYIYCYSENEPTVDGHFWHYDISNNPVKW